MKYVITGSTGNISLSLAQKLIAAGHDITLISSDENKRSAIEQLGAKAAIGNLFDTDFLAQTFTGADAAYIMIPPTFTTHDWPAFMKQAADSYAQAVAQSGLKKVVQLSSIGAHLGHSCGPIDGLGYLEQQLGTLTNVDVISLRAAYFYTNLFSMVPLIQQAGMMGSNFGAASEKMALVHPVDIAEVAAQKLLSLDFTGHSTLYVSSDVRTFSEIAKVVGNAVGKPELPWVVFSDEDAYNGMIQAGLPETNAQGYLQMGKAFRSGIAQEDYFATKAQPQGSFKLEAFAQILAQAV